MFGDDKGTPNVSVEWYLGRIVQYSGSTFSSMVASVVLIERALDSNPDFRLTNGNIHRVVLASVLISSKFFEDQFYPNSYYARVGGVSDQEMNELELAFLALVRFDLYITTAQFCIYERELTSSPDLSSGATSTPPPSPSTPPPTIRIRIRTRIRTRRRTHRTITIMTTTATTATTAIATTIAAVIPATTPQTPARA
ncbi:cyclin, N-terminal domain protein [Pelomyxa schiedti]|nr:cyclin, N-terminal domain protein [Pelomyxa schiedti]